MNGNMGKRTPFPRSSARLLLFGIGVIVLLKFFWSYFSFQNSDAELQELLSDQTAHHPKSFVEKDGKLEAVVETKRDKEAPIQKGLYTYGSSFYLDGKPFRILGGSFHYFRTHPAQWGDRLLKMKAAGLNTVTTYIPWNLHEPKQGHIEFEGTWNLPSFIKQAQAVGLYVIIRAGPYICSEWEFGGLPSWLLRYKDMIVRRSLSKSYLSAVDKYFSKLLPILAQYTYKRGGPIIAFQIENEFGSYGVSDMSYLHFLLEAHKKHGIDEMFMTSDGASADYLERGTIKDVLATVNFWKDVEGNFQKLLHFQPGKPLMVMEFWSGWFDHWGEKHHAYKPEDLKPRLHAILNKFNASINFYMFVGGSNHNFYNGANNFSAKYQPTITSYDYDAAIAENGDVTRKYMVIRDFLQESGLLGPLVELPSLPSNPPKAAYGKVKMESYMPFENVVSIFASNYKELNHASPQPMELLDIKDGNGQSYGWILYRGTFLKGARLLISGYIRDHLRLFINNKQLHVFDWTFDNVKVELDKSVLRENGVNTIDLLVENLGRVNYKGKSEVANMLDDQCKGFIGEVKVEDENSVYVIKSWKHVPLTFDSNFRKSVVNLSSYWLPFTMDVAGMKQPVLLRATFKIDGAPVDTFLDTKNWVKGIVMINSINLGRYWKIGPQRTFYVPGPLLREGENTLLIFELEKPYHEVELVGQALLG